MATVKMQRTMTVSIPNGQSSTDVIDLAAGPATIGHGSYRRWDLMIIALSGSHTGTINPQLSDTEALPGNFRVMQSGGADIVIAANKVTAIIPIVGRYFRLLSGSAEGGQRDFVLFFTTITNER